MFKNFKKENNKFSLIALITLFSGGMCFGVFTTERGQNNKLFERSGSRKVETILVSDRQQEISLKVSFPEFVTILGENNSFIGVGTFVGINSSNLYFHYSLGSYAVPISEIGTMKFLGNHSIPERKGRILPSEIKVTSRIVINVKFDDIKAEGVSGFLMKGILTRGIFLEDSYYLIEKMTVIEQGFKVEAVGFILK